jgi:hypothetical protein
MLRRTNGADLTGLPGLALLPLALAAALALAACSPPKSGSAGLGGVSTLAMQAYAGAPSQSAYASGPASAPIAVAPVLGSTRRDDRTLAAATPYEDRHGRAACGGACVEREAGYKWAALHTLTDETRCAGATVGFIDGCRAYALDHRRLTTLAAAGGKG